MSKAGVIGRLVLAAALLAAAGFTFVELHGTLRWIVVSALTFFGVLHVGQARTRT